MGSRTYFGIRSTAKTKAMSRFINKQLKLMNRDVHHYFMRTQKIFFQLREVVLELK